MALTDKQRRFVDEYLVDLNATQAALRAGYSEKTCNEQGSRLLANASVKKAIHLAQAKRAERLEITADKVLADIEKIKQDAMSASFDANGNKAMSNHAAALKAAELQGKHLGMWVEKSKVEHSGKVAVERIERVIVDNATDSNS